MSKSLVDLSIVVTALSASAFFVQSAAAQFPGATGGMYEPDDGMGDSGFGDSGDPLGSNPDDYAANGGGAGKWKAIVVEGFPQFSVTMTRNPDSLVAEPTQSPTTPQSGSENAIGSQLMYQAGAIGGAYAHVQGNINNNFELGDESLDLHCESSCRHSKVWQWEGDEDAFTPVKFGGVADISFSLRCSGTTGFDAGIFADPATSTSTASFNAGWRAAAPLDFEDQAGLEIWGKADNQLDSNSLNWVGIGGISVAGGTAKIFGMVLDFDQDTSQGDGRTYLDVSNASASERIGPAMVTSPGDISFSWNMTAIADTNLYTDGNTATGNASASVRADMAIGLVPDTIDDPNSLSALP